MRTPISVSLLRYCTHLRWVICFALLSLSPVVAINARAQAADGISVSGVVSNTDTDKALARAEVAIKDSKFTTLTESDGSYKFNGVPAGTYVIVASYAGLEDMEKSVTATVGTNAVVNFGLTTGIVTLESFKVAGVREGNAYAIQQQRTSETSRMVVSADAFGIASDSNPGEFLKSLPGMSMDYTGVEPRRVSLRGLEANQVQVLVNGNQVANAAGTSLDRAFEFDSSTIDNIEAMDITLAPRPDMPANSIAGTINIVTRSAFAQKGRRINGSFNVTGNDQALGFGKRSGLGDESIRTTVPGFSFSYSDTFLDGRLGVSFSASLAHLYGMGNTAYNTYAYDGVAFGGVPAAGNYNQTNSRVFMTQYRREDVLTNNLRTGSSLNLDFKLNDSSSFFVRMLYTDFKYQFRNHNFRFNAPTPVPGTAAYTTTPNYTLSGATANASSEQNMSFGDKYGKSWTFNPGAKHEFGAWKVGYDGWFSKATAHYRYPDFFSATTIRNSNIQYSVQKSTATAIGTLTQLDGPNAYVLANYAPIVNPTDQQKAAIAPRDGTDIFTGGKFNVRRDFDFTVPFWLEAGGFYQKQQRTAHNYTRYWAWTLPTGKSMADFASTYKPEVGERGPDAFISSHKLYQYMLDNPSRFTEDTAVSALNALKSDRKGSEIIRSGYVMGNTKLGDFDITAGARVESTSVKVEGAVQQGTGATAPWFRKPAYSNYTPAPLKDIHVKYAASKKLQARASYTEAFGRANMSDLIPNAGTFNDSTKIITTSNTTLKPQRSRNYDLGVEYYPTSTSVFTTSWFKKDISNYIVASTEPITAPIPELGIGPEYVNGPDIWRLTSRFNAGFARIEGYEFSGRYVMNFLPRAVGEVELWGNYTYLYKTEGNSDPTSKTIVRKELPGIAPWFWNLGIVYRLPNRSLSVNLKANFVADKTTDMTQRHAQTDDRLTVDGDITYKLTSHWSTALICRNFTNVTEGGTEAERTVRTGSGGGRALTLTVKASY